MLGIAFILLMPWKVWAQAGGEPGGGTAAEPAVYVNGRLLESDSPPIVHQGRILVPIRHLSEALNASVEWIGESKEAIITTVHGDVMVFQPDNPVMRYNDVEYRMDVAPMTVNQRIYIPLRHAAQFLHAEVEWDSQTQTAIVTLKDPYLMLPGETIRAVSERFGVDVALLVERNQLENKEAMAGYPIKYIIPDIMANKIEEPVQMMTEEEEASEAAESPFTEEELLLLAKITMVEAGYEPYEGQLAVVNVILNRLKDPRFPDTIRDVIYAPNQFPPAHNGLLDKAEPSESVWRAVREAVAGNNNVENAVYFYNPKVSSGKFWKSLTVIKDIGSHRFLK